MENTIYIDLPCALTDEELSQISDGLASTLRKYQDLREEKRETVKAYNKRIDDAEREFMRLAAMVNSRREDRPVRVREVFEYNTSTVMRIRTDTGEVVAKRAMKIEERQLELVKKLDEPTKQEELDDALAELREHEGEDERVSTGEEVGSQSHSDDPAADG